MSKHSMFIDCEPRPCPRPRFTRSGHAYEDGGYTAYKASLMTSIREAWPYLAFDPETPLSLTVCFSKRGAKADMERKNPVIRDWTCKPDVDNLVKPVMDALTQCGVIRDDSQVVELHAHKNPRGDYSGITITIGTI